jgi:hypothetical protein
MAVQTRIRSLENGTTMLSGDSSLFFSVDGKRQFCIIAEEPTIYIPLTSFVRVAQ